MNLVFLASVVTVPLVCRPRREPPQRVSLSSLRAFLESEGRWHIDVSPEPSISRALFYVSDRQLDQQDKTAIYTSSADQSTPWQGVVLCQVAIGSLEEDKEVESANRVRVGEVVLLGDAEMIQAILTALER